ncbi:hypothetical protein Nepgr_017886 [Nepenthes gracilis]|uniref:COP1-interacting protein 7 n=1 Tax=Nepenthes gracilis TaxID=150966 RepID=A0AAD3SSA4_NEPGR|nr:hypothetical protein Nepgr_017886 [Nepenthes gracilis]
MTSDVPLDYAVFQLSPKRSHCELFVSYDGTTDKLASGLVKPFVTNLKVAEEQVALAVKSIKLEVERHKNAEIWFTKGTLERFVRFVKAPEVLESIHAFDAEMSQLEAARRIYSQGAGDSESGGDVTGATVASDTTKKELLRAIDVRLVAARQDLNTACTRAAAAGFNPDTVSGLQLFADQFGAHHLSEACNKFISLCQRRPDLFTTFKSNINNQSLRSSSGSDMSLDDPVDDPKTGPYCTNRQYQQLQLNQSKPSLCQQPVSNNSSKPSLSFPLQCSSLRESSTSERERDDSASKERMDRDNNNNDKNKREENESKLPSSQTVQPTRRLSVQDRINLFENKQKENSSSASGSGDKPVVTGKSSIELRRLSSDVCSSGFEKTVLRRWSGASDMSIDLSGERKDLDGNASTLTPTSLGAVSEMMPRESSPVVVFSEDKETKVFSDAIGSSAKHEIKISLGSGGSGDTWIRRKPDSKREEVEDKPTRAKFGAQVTTFSGGSEDFSCESKLAPSVSGKSENMGLKDQIMSGSWSRSSCGGVEEFGLQNPVMTGTQLRSLPGKTVQFSSIDQEAAEEKSEIDSGGGQHSPATEQVAPGLQFREKRETVKKVLVAQKSYFGPSVSSFGGGRSDDEDYQVPQTVIEDTGLRNQRVPRSQCKASQSATVEVASDLQPVIQNKGVVVDSVAAQPKWKSYGGVDGAGMDSESVSSATVEAIDSGNQRMKPQKHVKRSQGRRDGGSAVVGKVKTGSTENSASENQVTFSMTSTTLTEQFQRVRQSKGNQGLNAELNELKMKANELEKLFAEHKLHVPGDQTTLTQRSKPVKMQNKQEASPLLLEVPPAQLTNTKMVADPTGGSNNMNTFNSTPLKKSLNNQDYDATPKQSICALGFSDDSRGEFYGKYMQKRDEKLKEEWSSKRFEKEARMKAMQDSLEKSRAELKIKLTGSADRHDAAFHARRAEKLRSFSALSATRRQQSIDALASDEDEEQVEFCGVNTYRQDGMPSETFLSDGSSRSARAKKAVINKNMASSTPRNSAAAVPRSSVKASNANLGRRRLQSENPLIQSVPNFSDLRKENTKPFSGSSKTAARPQVRSYARSKSGSEEKSRQPQSLRKSSDIPVELNDFSSLDSDGVVLTSLKSSQEETLADDEFLRNLGSKPFLRKGNGASAVTFSGIPKSKCSATMESLNTGDEDTVDMAKEEEDDDFELMLGEDCANMDDGKPSLSQESDKSLHCRSENSDAVRCVSQTDGALEAELPAALPSAVGPMGSVQDSLGEIPGSWNLCMHNPFSFSNEISDIDASVDSPIGSPAYWNSHAIAQSEAEAARMRKKWGVAQKPIIVTDSSHNQSRKDVTKGLKRFLKFGRKSRGAESLADWISATTSEGDDDTEDGRDPASRSLEDIGKSRMGFSHGHASDDGFNETDFNEEVQAFQSSIPAPPANFKLRDEHFSGSSLKVPRSFFSLSTFRSKASDSKPR